MKAGFACIVLILVLLAGCTAQQIPTGEVIVEARPSESICNEPYFEYKKNECCPDVNDNSLCDGDEQQFDGKADLAQDQSGELVQEIDWASEFEKKFPKSIDVRKEYALMVDEDDRTLGNKHAALTIVIFDNFQSPYSIEFNKEIYPKIKSEYVDTTKARIVFKHLALPYFEESQKAAEVAECAGEQGKFWEMKNKLFKHAPDYSNTLYFDLARELGLDIDAFRICVESEHMKSKVEYDSKFAQYLWVEKPPTLYINGRRMEGILPWQEYDDALKRIAIWEMQS